MDRLFGIPRRALMIVICGQSAALAGCSSGANDPNDPDGATDSNDSATDSADGTSTGDGADDGTGSESDGGDTTSGDEDTGSADDTGTGGTDDGGTGTDGTDTGTTGDDTGTDTGDGTGTDDAGTDDTATDTDDTGTDTDDTTVCGTGDENENVTLVCPTGLVIDEVRFASYGDPAGSCGGFSKGACDSQWSVPVVEALCIGRNACTLPVTNGHFEDPCSGAAKRLYVEVSCGDEADTGTLPFKGVANSDCAGRMTLGVSWYYNWQQNETEPCAGDEGGDFVPMIWGHTGNEQSAMGISNSVSSLVADGHEYVLGFNEPDNSTQANIPVSTAISLWPSFDNPDILVGSPATAANANPGQAWFGDFMAQLEDNGLRADFLAIHWYGWNAGSCDAEAAQLENYIRWVESFPGDRPIWLTEWGCLNVSAPDVQTVVDFYNGALAVFARHPRVQRYAWYPWATNCGLVADDGSMTALGQAYAEAPAYKQ